MSKKHKKEKIPKPKAALKRPEPLWRPDEKRLIPKTHAGFKTASIAVLREIAWRLEVEGPVGKDLHDRAAWWELLEDKGFVPPVDCTTELPETREVLDVASHEQLRFWGHLLSVKLSVYGYSDTPAGWRSALRYSGKLPFPEATANSTSAKEGLAEAA